MRHDWFSASAGGLIGVMWTDNPIKVALLKPSIRSKARYAKLWTEISAQEVTETAYAAGRAGSDEQVGGLRPRCTAPT